MAGGPVANRETVICRQHGERFEVFMGGDGQLWRWVTVEDRRRTRKSQELQLGQHLVAHSREAKSFLQAYGIDSPTKDRWLRRCRKLS